jgi:hypothetical protein
MDIYIVVSILAGIIGGFIAGASVIIASELLSKMWARVAVSTAVYFVVVAGATMMIPGHMLAIGKAAMITEHVTIVAVRLILNAFKNKKRDYSVTAY